MKKTVFFIVLMMVSTMAMANTTSPGRPGIGDYLCHKFGVQHWQVCKPFPGKR